MASIADIWNMALSMLGDTANVQSVDPPDATPQAAHCARFYPTCRDIVLGVHPWTFCTRRESLALIDIDPEDIPGWAYAYAVPVDMLTAVSVMEHGVGTPRPYVLELSPTDTAMILTNANQAVLRYTKQITDTTKYPATVVEVIATLLAAHIAGPLYKGGTGTKLAAEFRKGYHVALAKAATADKNQSLTTYGDTPTLLDGVVGYTGLDGY